MSTIYGHCTEPLHTGCGEGNGQVWRPGGWDAGGRPHILLVASEIGAPLDFLRVSAQAATPLLPQTSRFGYPCFAAPFPQGRRQLREAEKSQTCLLEREAL